MTAEMIERLRNYDGWRESPESEAAFLRAVADRLVAQEAALRQTCDDLEHATQWFEAFAFGNGVKQAERYRAGVTKARAALSSASGSTGK